MLTICTAACLCYRLRHAGPPQRAPATPHGQRTLAALSADQLAASRRPILEYVSSLIRIARWQLLAAVLIMTFTSLTEGLGVALLFPILQVAGFNLANQGHVGHYTGEVRALLVYSGLSPSLWLATLLLIFMLLMALRSLFSRVQSVLTFRTALSYELALSRRLYQAIINADWLFLVRRRSSDFTHALTAELTRVATCTYLLIGTMANAILALVYIALALKLSAGMTWSGAGHRRGSAAGLAPLDARRPCQRDRRLGERERSLRIGNGTPAESQSDEVLRRAEQRPGDVFLAPVLGPAAKPRKHQEPGSGRLLVRSRIAHGAGRHHLRLAADSQCGAGVHSSVAGGLYPPHPPAGGRPKPVAGLPQRASRL